MILNYVKKVNPDLLIEELRVLNSSINLTTHGENLKVKYPEEIAEQDIIDIIEAHVFISQEDRENTWVQQIKQEFQEASNLAEMKIVLAKIFKKIYGKLWDE